MIYLDYNATTPLHPKVIQAMLPYLETHFANPSSPHRWGKKAKEGLEKARSQVAQFIEAREEEVVFTSGGTEGNNHVLLGTTILSGKKKGHIITSSIEHPSILAPLAFLEEQGFHVTYLPVDHYGIVDIEVLKKSIRKSTLLVSIMAANNEVGTLQPLREIREITQKKGVLFHTDGAQWMGKLPFSVKEIGVDFLTFAGHKMYGPKGVGVIYIRKGIKLPPLLKGASHEKGRRGGTENLPAIVGLGKAASLAKPSIKKNMRDLQKKRDFLETLLLKDFPEATVHGHRENRLPNTLSIAFPGVLAMELMEIVQNQVAFSAGAACHGKGSGKISHVLKAMKVPKTLAKSTVRLSTGQFTSIEETEKGAQKILRALRKILKSRKK